MGIERFNFSQAAPNVLYHYQILAWEEHNTYVYNGNNYIFVTDIQFTAELIGKVYQQTKYPHPVSLNSVVSGQLYDASGQVKPANYSNYYGNLRNWDYYIT